MKHTGDPSKADCDLEIDIAVDNKMLGETATVYAGQKVGILCKGRIWTSPTCPGCGEFLVLGLEDEPLPSCAVVELPGPYPGVQFASRTDFTAPTKAGTYRIFGIVASMYTCEDSKAWYRQHPEMRFQLGTLTVTGPTPIPSPQTVQQVQKATMETTMAIVPALALMLVLTLLTSLIKEFPMF